MKRTLLVTLDLDASLVAAGELPLIARTVEEDLISAGHPVLEVKPWEAHGDTVPAALDPTEGFTIPLG